MLTLGSARRLLTAALLPAVLMLWPPGTLAAGEPLDWLQQYLRIDTTNPPGNEHLAAAFLRGILHREGIATELIVSATGRVNLMARLEAETPRGGALVLLHHMDVVAAGPGWSVDPFAGDLEGAYLWGRGAIDAKSLGIAHLAAFVDLKRRGAPLDRDVVLLAVADEESGGEGGVEWLLDAHPERFTEVSAVLGEGGQNRAYGNRQMWWGLEVAQKRPLWLKATARGRGAHGSVLNLHTAPHRLLRGLGRLVDRPPQLRLSDEVRAYFEAVAPFEGDHFRGIVSELDQIVQDEYPGRRLMAGMPTFLADSIQVNVLDAGERINTTPETAEALIDIRLLPDTDSDELLAEIREILGKEIEVEVLLSSPPAQASPSDGEIYRRIERALEPSAPVIPVFIPGVTDSRYFRLRGIPAYGFSPFVLESLDLRGIHASDEKIPTRAFERGVETMTRVVGACVTP